MMLTSARIVLRRLERRDLGAMTLMLNDWEVARWLARPPYPYRHEDAEAFCALVAQAHREPDPLLFAIAEAGSDRLVGTIGVELAGSGEGEIGYWLGRPFWGHGFAGEAIALVAAEARRARHLLELVAYVHPDNQRSQRVLEKCRFRRAGSALRGCRSGPARLLRYRQSALPVADGDSRGIGAAPA